MRSLFHAAAIVGSLWFIFTAYACLSGPPMRYRPEAGGVKPAPTLQVGLGRALRAESARIRVDGPYEIRGRTGVLDEEDVLDWVEVTVDEGILVDGARFEESPLTIVPARDGTLYVEYTRDHRGNSRKPYAVRYHGSLLIHDLGEGRLGLVNEVDLEDYLKGVVGNEMSLSQGEEALKTQVIAARTYAGLEQRLQRIREVKGERFDLYDDERSQVYGGMERETTLATRLVDETRGMFLVYEGRLVHTFYSSNCGGHTEPAWEIMGANIAKIPPLAGRKCEYCIRLPAHKWKEPAVFPKKEVVEKCFPPERHGATLKSVEITRTLPGGHALEVTALLSDSARPVKLHANHEFRRKLSWRKIRSTLWDRIEDRGDAIAIYGRGYGHGVGMCQLGAYEMAKEG